MAKKSLQQALAEKYTYSEDAQVLLESVAFEMEQLSIIDAMKHTEGWKILERKIKQELHSRIFELVKDDPRIKVLIDLITVADTKSAKQNLENEIESLLDS